MDLSRRTILQVAPVIGAAAALPTEALGAQDPGGAALAAGLRDRWATQSSAFLEGVLGEEAATAPEPLQLIGQGVGALDVLKELELLDAGVQAQPPLQALWREVLAATGRCGRLSAAAIEAWLAPGGDRGDLEGRHVRGMLGALRIGLRGANTRASRRAQIDAALAGVLDDPAPGSLKAHARRLARRTRKAEALAQHLAADPDTFARTFTLDPNRAAALGVPVEAVAASASASATASGRSGAAPPNEADVALGILATGAMILFGLILGVVGLCASACGAGAVGIPLMLLGASLVVLAGARRRDRTYAAQMKKEEEPPRRPGDPPPQCPACPDCGEAPEADDPWSRELPWRRSAPSGPAGGAPPAEPSEAPDEPAGPAGAGLQPPEPVGWMSVPADAGWVPAPGVEPDRDHLCLAWGLVQTGRAWPADPDGDGVAAGPGAPLPGAPSGALVGQVGGRTFFLGSEGLVPPGLSGPLLLAVNLSPAAAAQARGGVEVQLLQRPRGARDA